MGLPSRREIKHRIEFAFVRVVLALTALVPRRALMGVGAMIGEFAYRVLRIRRRVVESNLASTLGQFLPARELERIARAHYHHLGRTLLEYARMGRTPLAELHAMVDVVYPERAVEAVAAGRGVVFLTGHFGSWELFGSAGTAGLGVKVHFLAKRQSNPYSEDFMGQVREHLGFGVIRPGVGIRRVFRALKSGESVGMLADQDAGRSGLFLDVLGRPASVQTGPAVFAIRSGAPILCGFIVRQPDGRHQGFFEEPIFPDPSADRDAEVERLTRIYTAHLERFILRYPEQYYWVHRRWKTPPPNGSSDDGSVPVDRFADIADAE